MKEITKYFLSILACIGSQGVAASEVSNSGIEVSSERIRVQLSSYRSTNELELIDLEILEEAIEVYIPKRAFSMNHLPTTLEGDGEFVRAKRCSDVCWFSNRLVSHFKYIFGVGAGITSTIGEFWFVGDEVKKVLQVPTTALLFVAGVFDLGDRCTGIVATSCRKKARKRVDEENWRANTTDLELLDGPFTLKNVPEVLSDNARFRYLSAWGAWYSMSERLYGAGTCLSWGLATGCSVLGMFGWSSPTVSTVFRVSSTLLVWLSGLFDGLGRHSQEKTKAAYKEMQGMLNDENSWYRGMDQV